MTKTFLRKSVLAVALAAASSAYAASVGDVYSVPASLPTAVGQLVTYSPTTIKQAGAPGHTAFKVLYTSKDSTGAIKPVTGTVIVPKSGNGNVVLYAIGTHGLGQGCSASKQLEAGTDYEGQNVVAALNAGYTVLVSDYVGYTNFTPYTDDELEENITNDVRYMAGPSQARNVLDLFKAATQIPSGGVNSSAKVGIWGFSQGGQASAHAAQIAATYAPGVNIVGVASGGVPADFPTTALYLNGSSGASFLFSAITGLRREYGADIPLPLLISSAGAQQIEQLKTKCVFEALLDYKNQTVESYLNTTKVTLASLLTQKDVARRMGEQRLGVPVTTTEGDSWSGKFSYPMYLYHGKADEFIPLGQAYELKQRWCALGNNVTFDLYPSEHIATMTQGATKSLAFLGDRFSGKSASGTCNSGSVPTSTALDNKAGLGVTMAGWPLSATVHVKTMNQDVILPQGSSLDALASNVDTGAGTLSGTINIPDFKQGLKIIGIGAQVGLKIAPLDKVAGTVGLDRTGTLKVTGKVPVDITVTSVWGIPFGVCKTSAPVNFDLNYSGSVSNLGTGLVFAGTTSFPQIKGCIISAIISALMSGSGQTYSFLVAPPAPVAN
jgi:dienelactone hydrolase